MCQIRTLGWKGETIVSECVNCHKMNLWHDNLMLTFEKETFIEFKKLIDTFDFDEHCILFPDGSERVLICSPHQDIQFTFSHEEFITFKTCIDEALYLSEVYRMLESPTDDRTEL